jgi:hypothetical protein
MHFKAMTDLLLSASPARIVQARILLPVPFNELLIRIGVANSDLLHRGRPRRWLPLHCPGWRVLCRHQVVLYRLFLILIV